MENASARNLWGDFLDAHLEFASLPAPKVIHLYDNPTDADAAVDLICRETKRARTRSLKGIQLRHEKLPQIGDFYVVTDWQGKAWAVIRTTSVKLIPYFAVRDDHARLEGDGDKSLSHWKKIHWEYLERELSAFGAQPSESMIMVFEAFELHFKN